MIAENTHENNLQAALSYVQRSWPVLPLCWPENGQCGCGRGHTGREIGKAPLTPHAHLDASTNPKTIRQWWQQWPKANIGLALRPIKALVLDLDGPEAVAEAQSLGIPQGGPCWKRGPHSIRYLFALPPGVEPKRVTRKGSCGKIDVLGDGYVILPPSRHASGDTYEWVTEPSDTLPLPPGWVIGLFATEAPHTDGGGELGPEPTPQEAAGAISVAKGLLPERYHELLDGSWPAEATDGLDRSASAYHLALTLHEHGIRDPRAIALVVFGSAVHSAKFDHRPDAWVDACRVALRVVEQKRGEETPEEQNPADWLLAQTTPASKWFYEAPEAEWLWESVIYRGHVHLLAGREKRGKSRFLHELLAVLTDMPERFTVKASDREIELHNGRYWGLRHKTFLHALVVTEESPTTWRKRGVPLGAVDFLPAAAIRKAGTAALAEVVRRGLYDLIVLDTADKILGVTDENDNAQIAAVLTPLAEATHASPTALLLCHHHRKAGGEGGDEVRGGTAWLGAVDVYLAFSSVKGKPRVRRLEVRGRLDHPEEALEAMLENVRDGIYVLTGDRNAATQRNNAATQRSNKTAGRVIEFLQQHGQPTAPGEIAAALGVKPGTVRSLLSRLAKDGKVKQAGRGKYAFPTPSTGGEEGA